MIDAIIEWFTMVRIRVIWRKKSQDWLATIQRGAFGVVHKREFKTQDEAIKWIQGTHY